MKTTIEININELNDILKREFGFKDIYFNSAEGFFNKTITIVGDKRGRNK